MSSYEAAKSKAEVSNLSFFKSERTPGKMEYIFDGVVVSIQTAHNINTTYDNLPEISFATRAQGTNSKFSLSRPEVRDVSVSMEYIAECVKTVAADAKLDTFWFYPFSETKAEKSEEGNTAEEKEEREKEIQREERARARLFSRFGRVEKSPDGQGYVLRV